MRYVIEKLRPGLWVVYIPGRLDAVDINFGTAVEAAGWLKDLLLKGGKYESHCD